MKNEKGVKILFKAYYILKHPYIRLKKKLTGTVHSHDLLTGVSFHQ